MSITLFLTSCSNDDNKNGDDIQAENNTALSANIVSVEASGESGNYTFNVGISSPDKGCNQYANWWEVITEDGALIYRRILAHSHVNEQPFVRSGGTIPITTNQLVIIRAHMNTSGYGTTVFKGSISNGFTQDILDENFANDVENLNPQPSGCAF